MNIDLGRQEGKGIPGKGIPTAKAQTQERQGHMEEKVPVMKRKWEVWLGRQDGT